MRKRPLRDGLVANFIQLADSLIGPILASSARASKRNNEAATQDRALDHQGPSSSSQNLMG